MILPRRLIAALLAPVLILAVGINAAMIVQQVGQSQHVRAGSRDLALTGRVTDAAHLLSAAQTARLTAVLATLERDTGHQLVVVTVPSLHREDIGAFTLRHANTWGVGRAEFDDGVVVLVAPNERRVRIEVGRGLERVLTNARCAEIIRQRMLPRFARGDLPGGIAAGVAALDVALR